MRVVHFNPSTRGIGDYGLLLADAFRKMLGDDFVLVAHPDQAAHCADLGLLDEGRGVIAFRNSARTVIGRLWEIRRSLLSVVREVRPTVVHDTAGTAYTPGAILWPDLSRLARLVVTEHDPEPHTGMGWEWHETGARWLRRSAASGFVAHGPRGKEQLVATGISPDDVTVQPIGPMDRVLPPLTAPVEREPKTVLFFGALRPNKGVELLPSIARLLADRVPGARLIVAGSPNVARSLQRSDWPGKLECILSELRALSNVELQDRFIPHEKVRELFLRSEVAVLPYLDATQSAVSTVAMPLGTVVVATDVGDLSFAIRSGETGILCHPESGKIADTVARLLLDRPLRERLRNAALRATRGRLSWERIAKDTLRAYKEFAG